MAVVQARDPDATRTRPAAAQARRPSPPVSRPVRRKAPHTIEDILPIRADGDRAVSINSYGERHGFNHKQASLWFRAVKEGRFQNFVDAEQVQGKPWRLGRTKVSYIIYREGRDEFLRRYWYLPYVGPCGRPGCECADMPAKDGEGNVIDINTWERIRWPDGRALRWRRTIASATVDDAATNPLAPVVPIRRE